MLKAMSDLETSISELAQRGPRTYARWSDETWRQVCAGPASTLWSGLTTHVAREPLLKAYLTLLHAAVGLQYVGLANDGSVDLRGSFLSRSFCDVLPRLLPQTDAPTGLAAMTALWNAGERLQTKAPWLDRYLSARITELPELASLGVFLLRSLEEGLEPLPSARFTGPATWRELDCSVTDRRFLPGECHLATPSIVCVHDRKRPDVHTAVLLRKDGAVSLGATPCLGQSEAFSAPDEKKWLPLLTGALPEPCAVLATDAGFILVSTIYSQRVWIGHSA
jgi:hypothetical protein